MNLCSISGNSSPIMVSPITADQMLNVLSTIDESSLDETSQVLYRDLKDNLENPKAQLKYKDNLLVNGFADFSFEFDKQAEDENDFSVAKKDRKPMVNLGAEIHFDSNIYAYFSYDFTNTGLNYNSDSKKFKPYTTNFTFKYDSIDFGSPHRAFLSLGRQHINMIIGRDRMNFGNGISGNLGLGNTLWYQDFVKASIFNGPISYDFSVLSFENSTGPDNPFELSHNALAEEPHQLVFLHNLSFEPIKQLSFTIYEGALVYGSSITEDLRNINPMFVLHNTFEYMISGTKGGTNAGNMNNFFGAEARYTFKNGWAFDVQAMFDQIQFADEKDPEEPQNAFGFIANVTKTTSMFGGLTQFFLEGAYTSPNLYLKEDQVACGEYWNMDLIVGKMLVWTPSRNDFSYLGYQYGPDTAVLKTGFSWNNYTNLKLGFSAMYKMHGTQGAKFYEGQNDTTHEMGEDLKSELFTTPVEKRLVLNLGASYSPAEFVDLEGVLDYQKAWNYHNILNRNDFSNVQFTFCATVHPMSLINRK